MGEVELVPNAGMTNGSTLRPQTSPNATPDTSEREVLQDFASLIGARSVSERSLTYVWGFGGCRKTWAHP